MAMGTHGVESVDTSSQSDSSRFDLAVKSKRIWSEGSWIDGWIGIRGEQIASISREPITALEALDVGMKPVIPGLIDTHAHFRDPGYTYKEDFESGTRAAAAGGVTTVFDMPNVAPPTTTVERLEAHIANARSKACIDFGHNASGVDPNTIVDLAAAGATAFKIWQLTDIGRDYPHPPGTSVSNHGVLYQIFEQVREANRTLYVHPHDQELYSLFVKRSQEEWGLDFRSYARAVRGGDGVILNTAIAQLLEFQRSTGASLHVLHLSTRRGVEMVRAAKAEGLEVTAEANPFAMFITNNWNRIEEKGPFALGFWIPDADNGPMWEAIIDGTIDVVASDHGPHTREEKELGWTDMYSAPAGSPFIEHYLRLLLTKVDEGVLPLDRVIELCCTAPARLTRLYPRKGEIAVGSDADLVVLDLEHEEVLTAARSHYRCGWTPAEGLWSKGAPVITILRGRIIMQDSKVTAEPGTGRWIDPRPSSASVRQH